MAASTPTTNPDTATRPPSGGLIASAELASSISALLLMAGAVLAESSEEGRMTPYDAGWLQHLINNLEAFGGAIVSLVDSASHVAGLPLVQRAD